MILLTVGLCVASQHSAVLARPGMPSSPLTARSRDWLRKQDELNQETARVDAARPPGTFYVLTISLIFAGLLGALGGFGEDAYYRCPGASPCPSGIGPWGVGMMIGGGLTALTGLILSAALAEAREPGNEHLAQLRAALEGR